MTPSRKFSFIKTAKDISISSTLSIIALGFGTAIATQQCTSDTDEAQNDSYEETQDVYNKGIRSYITEISPGEFKITDEITVPKDSARAIIRYADGHRDTLTLAAAKQLIDSDIRSNQSTIGQQNNLSSVLLYGGMGYLLANTMGNSYMNTYRNSSPMNLKSGGRDSTRYRRSGSRTFASRFYANSSSFQRSEGIHQEVSQSKTSVTRMVSRPVRTRSGFFRSGGRGFGG